MAEKSHHLEGHTVLFSEGPAGPELLVDDSPVPIIQMGEGYVLQQDAFAPVSTDPYVLAEQFLKMEAVAQYRSEHPEIAPSEEDRA
jgi:hypothetical protein